MMDKHLRQLDNPVWHSLCEVHAPLAINYEEAKFYRPNYCPFGACSGVTANTAALDDYACQIPAFFVIGERPVFSRALRLKKELECLQMVLDKPFVVDQKDEMMQLVKEEDGHALYSLVNAVQPGYFQADTGKMGSYYGIFREGKLVAAAGERMKMNRFTEISAVVTHPDHRGQGLARRLIDHITIKIFEEGKTPFLHVAISNEVAIRLYETLGFRTRRKISFWNIELP